MDNPINNLSGEKIVETTSQVISDDVKPKKFRLKVLCIILTSLILFCLATIAYMYFNEDADFLNISNTIEEILEQEEEILEQEEETNLTKQATIKGSLSYPSEIIPSMKVCAVNTEDGKETCTQTEEGQSTYTLSVTPETYFVYSSADNMKTYYTLCDTYEDGQTDPRCNSNFDEKEGTWNDNTFVCYQDPVCKAAYTPLPITVVDQEILELNTMIQGWYIPCSHNTEVCNNPDFDVWNDYLDENILSSNQYDIFGASDYSTLVTGYLKVITVEPSYSEMEGAYSDEQELSYFLITNFKDFEFRNSIADGINRMNGVNKFEEGHYLFGLGCIRNEKIYSDEITIDDRTNDLILSSNINSPLTLRLYFTPHNGSECNCCSLAEKIIAE